MNLIRRLFRVRNPDLDARASATSLELQEAKRSYEEKLHTLEKRKNDQSLNIQLGRRSEMIMEQWGGAMQILRERE